MLEYARWKYILLLLIVVLSAIYAMPNIYPQDPSVQVTASRGAAVDEALQGRIAATLAAAGIKPKSIEAQGDNLLVRLANVDIQGKAADALRPALGENYVVALNLASTVPEWLGSIGAGPMMLGLDLQGGVHFLMQVDQKAAIDKRFESYLDDLRVLLRENRVRYEGVERRGADQLVVTLAPGADVQQARELISSNMVSSADAGMAGGARFPVDAVGNAITVRIPESEITAITANAIEQNVGTLRNRINELGVAEPIIQRQGTERVVVQLPGVQDTAQAKRILGATATLEYRAVVDGNAYDAVASGRVPPEARIYYRQELGPDGKPVPMLLNKRVIATGEQLVDARQGFDSQSGSPMVSVTLNAVGGQRMFDFTSNNVGKLMAVVYIERIPQVSVVDGKEVRTMRTREQVINAATIQGVFGKNFQTTGLESPKFAADLALQLRAGALAAPMDFVEERVVGPSLGKENIDRGVTAVTFAFGFVMLFFLFYYRVFGVITNLALLLNLLMLVAVMSFLDATLTLPGLAGIALTVGMSVDANVLINERIREELRAGVPPQAAIASGYDQASGTITDSNITTLLAGIALFAFGTGPVKGFAVALIAGILTSMYSAMSASRGISTLIYGGRRKLKSIAI